MLSKKKFIFRWKVYARYFVVEKNPRLVRNAGFYPRLKPAMEACPPLTPNVTSVFRVFTSVAEIKIFVKRDKTRVSWL
jgi:hypothetical protein